ncbi:amidohydrolase family protein [Psychroflexus sp. CAK1W]|uniref:amidohydrolase family protein n=1 Tax=Psychroflexus curvus TaxID=2873595 RepID=UPI001CCE4C77|nr:amidohydrolase family protein [Psychroflexus curvus]MBZ9628118.1 amidohydrolase family protein [Psychroflexus curvus]
MKSVLVSLLIFLISIGNSIAQNSNDPETVTAFINATVIDGTGIDPLENATVVIVDKKITCVGKCETPKGAKIIDVKGKYIIPGLVDAHVHYDGDGSADPRPNRNDPERFHRSYLCSGITAVFDTGGPIWTLDLRDDAEGSTAAPHIVAAGPLLTTTPNLSEEPDVRRLNVHMDSEEAARFGVRMLSWLDSDAVKVWGLEIPEDREKTRKLLQVVAEEAKKADLPVIAHGHTLESAKDALREGNASVLLHPVSDTLVDEEFLELALKNDAVYITAMGYTQVLLAAGSSAGSGYSKISFPEQKIPLDCVDPKTRSRLSLIDSLPPKKWEFEKFRETFETSYKTHSSNLKRIHDAGITVAAGTDAGNLLLPHGPSLHTEMETMASAGLTPMEVLVASTRNGAKAMGRLDEFGTLEAGKVADMVVLEKNPLEDISNIRSIELVVRGGKVWTHDEMKYNDED